NNYVRYFNLMREATYLNACLLHYHSEKIRKNALQIMNKAFNTPKGQELFPMEDLLKILAFENATEAIGSCKHYNIDINREGVYWKRKKFIDRVTFPKTLIPYQFIEAKAEGMNISDIVRGTSSKMDMTFMSPDQEQQQEQQPLHIPLQEPLLP